MRRLLSSAVVIMALAAIVLVIGGCGLTEERKARILEIQKENEVIQAKIEGFVERAKSTGDINLLEIAAMVEPLKTQLKKNLEELKAIQAEAGTSGLFGAIAGLFGRSALHLVTKIPMTGPLGVGLQAILGLLLGGSSTEKKAAIAASPPAPAAPPG